MTTDQTKAVPAPGLSTYEAAVDTVAQHIAAAFIASNSKEVHAFARDLAHAARMKDIALRPDDIPF